MQPPRHIFVGELNGHFALQKALRRRNVFDDSNTKKYGGDNRDPLHKTVV